MILDELVLKDFGVYRGRQSFALTPLSADKPIVLIGAQNGGGKTTFLEGLQLAFFGRLAHGALRGGVAYEDYLERSLNRSAGPDGEAEVAVRFRRTVEGEEQAVQIRRSWCRDGARVRESFEVWVNGAPDRVLASHWNEHVEALLPPRIAPLFFFDGEKIEQFAQLERSGEIVSTAVSGLLGLDIVDRLQLDLDVFERRKVAAQGDRTVQAELKAAAEAAQAADAAYTVAREESAAATRERDRRRVLLDRARATLKAEGGDLYAARNDLLALEQQLDSALEMTERSLRGWAAEQAPLMLVPDLLRDIAELAEREAESDAARAVIQVLHARDKTLIGKLKAAGATGVVLQAAQAFMTADRQRLQQQALAERFLDLPPVARSHLAGLLEEGFTAAEDLRLALLVDLDKLTGEKDDVSRQIAAIPAPETVAPLLAAVRAEEEALTQAEVRLAAARQLEEAAERTRTQARGRYQARLADQVERKLVEEDARRMLDHAARVRRTLDAFRTEVVRHHLTRIERYVVEALQRLLRKDDLVTSVEIDPQSFAIRLKGGGWDELPPEQLSAGERQLFAVALLWALARASGQTAPTIIDTPLGRLDSEHRSRLVEGYFPHAGRQVILLSTDEEIDARQYSRLRPYLSRSLTIEYDTAARGSRVREGYGFVPAEETA